MKAEMGRHKTLQHDAVASQEEKTTLVSRIFSRKPLYLLLFLMFSNAKIKEEFEYNTKMLMLSFE